MLTYPIDTVRRKMIMQTGKKVRDYSNTIECFKKTYHYEGVRGFYKGALINYFRSLGATMCLILND